VPSAASDGMIISSAYIRRLLRRHACALASLRHSAAASPYRMAHRPTRSPLTVQLPFGGKVNRTIDATRTNAIVICLNQFYFEPKFSRQLVSNSAKSSFTTLMLSLCQALHIIPHQLLKRVRSS
jgi:hypothetical protein